MEDPYVTIPHTPEEAVADQTLEEIERENFVPNPDRDNFSRAFEKRFKVLDNREYRKIAAKADFNRNTFSKTLDGDYVYTEGASMKYLTINKVFITPYMWNNFNRAQRSRLKNQARTDQTVRARFALIRNELPKHRVINYETNIIPEETSVRHGTSQNINTVVKANQGFKAIQDPNIDLTFNTVTKHELLHSNEVLNLRSQTFKKYLKELPQRTFFKEVITERSFNINPHPETREDFNLIIIQKFNQIVLADIQGRADNIPPPYYHIFFRYINEDGHMVTLPVMESYSVDRIQELLKIDNKVRWRFTSGGSHPSDWSEIFESYYLDFSYFKIQKIDIYTRAGTRCTPEQLLDKLDLPTTSHQGSVFVLDWCRVKNYPSSNNGCFYKILFEVLKKCEPNLEYNNYKSLWKDINPSSYQKKTSDVEAYEAAQSFNINLIIYDRFGTQLYPRTNDNLNNNSNENILRIMNAEGHYVHIIQYSPKEIQSVENIDQNTEKQAKVRRRIVYYDLETIYTNDLASDSQVIPYAIAYAIEDSKPVFVSRNPSQDKIFESLLIDLEADYDKQQNKYNKSISYKLIAYNGSSFDHIMLHSHLIRKGYKCIQEPSLQGKVKNFKFIIKRTNVEPTCFMFIEIWDPNLFLNRSLAQAARDFQLSISKDNIDHKQIQKLYEEDKLLEFLVEHHEKIKTYTIQDILVMRELVKCLRKTFNDEFETDPLNYLTLPHTCFTLWKKRMDVTGINVCPAPDKDIDIFIRRACVGGRVQAIIGQFDGEFYQVDVSSLYPFLMMMRLYPVGLPTELISEEECENILLDETKRSIIECEINQESCTGKNLIRPFKSSTLDWSYAGTQTVVLPCVLIKLLRKYNCSVKMFRGYTWTCKDVFSETIKQWSKLKTNQDLLKSKKDPSYNPCLREMSKMLMNSLSGKMVQKVYNKRTMFWNDFNKILPFLERMQTDGKSVPVYPLSSNVAYTEHEIDGYSHKCKPSHIGAFIYAYSHEYMYEKAFSRFKVYYSDTDSVIIDKKDMMIMKDEGLIWEGGEKVFGMFVDEGTDYGKIGKMIITAPKSYCLLDKDDNLLKCRMKGIRPNDLYNGVEVRNCYREFFLDVLIKKEVTVQTWNFQRKMKEGMVKHRLMDKIVKLDEKSEQSETLLDTEEMKIPFICAF